ncbi:hypothetical protein ACIQU6_25985 [Streptomyces sp. NPDC090442]|uniref:hypothetical protein n=1 Tax=Streptomyces sp. NPDC090442 TaxID=3365962 RepID=UPI0038208B60
MKINSHRVELGELRHHVLSIPGVANAAFDIVRGPLDALELFVLPRQMPLDSLAFAETVRNSLAAALPSALVPQEVHVVPEIVFTPNGKCDIRATRRNLFCAGRPADPSSLR